MRCSRCQHEARPGAKFCEECAASLARSCAQCGTPLVPTAKFCPECAHPVSEAGSPVDSMLPSPASYTPKHLAERILTSRAALEGERKSVTVLFCDLANSTGLAERLGPEPMHSLLNRFFELALAEVHRYEGTINQFLGDGFMALFGAPVAHEDHARRAVLAALGIQRVLREHPGEPGEELVVRIGLNSGPVVVGKIGDNLRMDYTAVGDTTNLAARLQQLAAPGTVLVSDATARLVKGYVQLESLAPVHVKGKTDAVRVSRVVGVGPRRSPLDLVEDRSLGEFVGRARELADLQDLVVQAQASQGQVVGIVGEPGVGKSRLLREFRRSLAGQRLTYLEGRCLSFGSTIPYLPLTDIIRSNCGITESETPASIVDKVRDAVVEVGMDPDESAPYLLRLLGGKEGTERLDILTPSAIKERTFETLRHLALKGARRRPIVLAVEDLHWVDRTSEEFLSFLVESLSGAAILLLVTYRPGYRPPWIDKSYASQLTVRPLSRPDSLTVVQPVVQRARLPEDRVQMILDRAEGNPFFLEELTRVVLEQTDFPADLAIPATIQAVLMSRIDRLPDAPKRLVQTAAVLGREFTARLLRELWTDRDGTEPHLRQLQRLEFVYERTGTEEPVYLFKHALTQEVAYESLLLPRRKALHAAAGQALETLYAGRQEEVYDRLAYHYARADEADKAVEYLTHLAAVAARGHAHVEAVTALEQALQHAARLPAPERDRRLLDVVLRLAESLHYLGRRREIVDLLLQHRERLEQLGEPAVAGPYYFRLGFTYSFLGDRQRAAESLMRAFAAATQSHDERTLGRVKVLAGLERGWAGQFDEAIDVLRQAVALLGAHQERWWLGWAHYVLAFVYNGLGRFALAREAAAEVGSIGDTIGDRRLRALAAQVGGMIDTFLGEWDAAIAAQRHALALSPDPFETAQILGFLGLAYLEKGDAVEAIPTLQQAVQEARQYRSRQIQCQFEIWLGLAYLLVGEVDKATELASEGLEVARELNYRWGVGLAQRALGLITQARGNLAEADRWLTAALETFRAMQASPYVGLCHLELAFVARAAQDLPTAATHVTAACSIFRALDVPYWVKQAERLATTLQK